MNRADETGRRRCCLSASASSWTGSAVAHLATADARAAPHVVPVCFALDDSTLYITIDDKPKRGPGLRA